MRQTIKKIHDNIFIIKENEKNTKLILRNKNCFYSYGDTIEKIKFNDFEKMIKKIPLEIDEEQDKNQINGYPIKHENFSIFNKNDKEKYKKEEIDWIENKENIYYTVGSNIIYCAGYWAIKNNDNNQNMFNKRYYVVHCPKLSTVMKNKHKGPFRDRYTAIQEALILSRREMK